MVYKIPSYRISDFDIRLILLPRNGIGPLMAAVHCQILYNTDDFRYSLRFERSFGHCVGGRLPGRDVTGQEPEEFTLSRPCQNLYDWRRTM